MKQYKLELENITTMEDLAIVLDCVGGITINLTEEFYRLEELKSYLTEVPSEMEVIKTEEDNTIN